MRASPFRITKPTVFAALMLISALFVFLPRRQTRPLAAVLQPLGWIQSTLAGWVRSGRDVVEQRAETPREHALAEQVAELERQLGQQGALLMEFEQRLEDVTHIREAIRDESFQIVPAMVIGGDASPRRDTLQISRGSLHGISAGQWVVAGRPLSQGDAELRGMDLLVRQWLIGRIAESQQFLARVQLTTDAGFGPQRVRAARVGKDGAWQIAEAESLLYGRGGKMAIVEAKADFRAAGYPIALAPASADLPTPLSIGQITASARLSAAPLHYNLDVAPWSDPRELQVVYVLVRKQ
ncbi:MAG: rod shape-determining protein MreC [Phycisphaerae bacterium]